VDLEELQKRVNDYLKSCQKPFSVQICSSFFNEVDFSKPVAYYKDSGPFYFKSRKPLHIDVETDDEDISSKDYIEEVSAAPGIKFVDVSNQNAMIEKNFSKTAPAWRTAVSGLNIEGECKNVSCATYNKMVIVKVGYGTFDLIFDEEKCKCPICQKFVAPITCGFTDCAYSISGMKKDSRDLQKWETVGNLYKFHDPKESGETNWISLKIHTRPPSGLAIVCGVCKKSMESPFKENVGIVFMMNA